jgi:hypothetical protein
VLDHFLSPFIDEGGGVGFEVEQLARDDEACVRVNAAESAREFVHREPLGRVRSGRRGDDNGVRRRSARIQREAERNRMARQAFAFTKVPTLTGCKFPPRVTQPLENFPRRADGGVATGRQHEAMPVRREAPEQILDVTPHFVGTPKTFRLHRADAAGNQEPVAGQPHDLVELHIAERWKCHAFQTVHAQ